ncbi:MAG: SPOR domain-containing protein [Fidelibacterota bacterium]
MTKAFCFVVLTGFFFCQSAEVQQLIQDVQNGDTKRASEYISKISPSTMNSADILYLAGLVESDSEKAMEWFRKIVNDFPGDDLTDDAMMKLGEYYYVSGLYVQAANWFKEVVDEHPDYENFNRSAKLLLKSLSIAGESEMVREYTQKFLAEIPNLWDDDIRPKPSKGPVKYVVKQEEKSGSGFYLQLGAFSQAEGANSRADHLIKNGYAAFVELSKSGGKSLNTVLLGPFETREDAIQTKSVIKTKLSIDSFIVQK